MRPSPEDDKSIAVFPPVFCHHRRVSPTSSLSAGKILVIDDDPVVLKVMSLVLQSEGYQVFEAGDGPAAFHLARRVRPDLIVLDIFFPPDAGQSGNSWDAFMIIEWFQHMGAVGNTPIIVVSGAEPGQFRKRCLASGVAAFLSKPVNPGELLDAVGQILGGRASRGQPCEHSSHSVKMPSACVQRSM
jgi:CheY-like chemotaxis protein